MYTGNDRNRSKEKERRGGGEESRRRKQRGGKGKANILSPPGTQLAARGCCLYIRTVDRAVAEKKRIT